MTKYSYVPSVNILRDAQRNMPYIPTPNGRRVVHQLVDNFKKGLRAFNLIGSYGTGKSSFLVALEQSLYGRKPYFEARFVSDPTFGTLKLIGEYRPVSAAFAEKLGLPANAPVQDILQEIYHCYHDLGGAAPLLAIEIDEFGKFLEYAAQQEAEKELYFIQQLAEFAGNPDYNILLITTIHQGFENYAYGLTAAQRQEWSKVKGRFHDITFNEPVDQLLFLAAEHIEAATSLKGDKKQLKASFELFQQTKAFTFSADYAREIYDRIYPLDVTAAIVLTLSLQRYGQNERSLFSFLEATDHTSLEKFRPGERPFYDLSAVYDYLNFNFYSFLTSKYNPDFAAWSAIRLALETTERAFEQRINDLQQLIKVIGLLNIYAAAGTALDKAFLSGYATVCTGISDAGELLRRLEEKQIIRFRKHSQRYVLYEGTDLDIQTALIEAANKVSAVTDVPTLLRKHFDFTPVLTKAYSFETGTPRSFRYIFTETPVSPEFEDDVDGYINLIFSDGNDLETVRRFSGQVSEAVLFGYYEQAKEVKDLLYEIEKTQKVLDEHKEDKVARKELEQILSAQQNLLNHYIVNNLFGPRSHVRWIWQGRELQIASKRLFNRQLSQICTQVYPGTPVYKNELVNRPKLSGSIYAAKKNFFQALTLHWDKPDLNFDPGKFPPEKTIYLTLLRENGLDTAQPLAEGINGVRAGSSFEPLWDACCGFLQQCKDGRRNLEELTDLLRARPFRLKQGLIDFWLPTFLFLRRNDFALFSEDGFIPELNTEILDLISKTPRDYTIKAFDIAGVKLDIFNSYRTFLNQGLSSRLSNRSFIETIKPFLVFYRQLPEYARQTKRLPSEALAVRHAIAQSKDPERSFFEDFPAALGYTLEQLQDDKEQLNAFTSQLQGAIREIRTSYEQLQGRLERYIQQDIVGQEVDFEVYKELLKKRFKKLKRHLLLPHQRSFIQRIDSALDDQQAWLVSIAQTVTGRSLENFRDEDEIQFYDKLQQLVFELDSLTQLSGADIDEEKEEVLGIQFDSFASGVKNSLVRLPKHRAGQIDSLKSEIAQTLSKDRLINIAALTKLLQELIGK